MIPFSLPMILWHNGQRIRDMNQRDLPTNITSMTREKPGIEPETEIRLPVK